MYVVQMILLHVSSFVNKITFVELLYEKTPSLWKAPMIPSVRRRATCGGAGVRAGAARRVALSRPSAHDICHETPVDQLPKKQDNKTSHYESHTR